MNYYCSAFENCYSTIAISNKQAIDDDDVVGINCFDELLFRSEFISYARDKFKHEIEGKKLLFFSKRLEVYIYEDDNKLAYIYNINDKDSKLIGFSQNMKI